MQKVSTYSARNALNILSTALSILATSYTDRGYKFVSNSTGRLNVCALGAIDEAYKQLKQRKPIKEDFVQDILQDQALKIYNRSFVSVNDEIGYKAIVRVFASAIKECNKYAAGYY